MAKIIELISVEQGGVTAFESEWKLINMRNFDKVKLFNCLKLRSYFFWLSIWCIVIWEGIVRSDWFCLYVLGIMFNKCEITLWEIAEQINTSINVKCTEILEAYHLSWNPGSSNCFFLGQAIYLIYLYLCFLICKMVVIVSTLLNCLRIK